jgi:Bifunctional DNA primase/polymerase, N-terminal
MAGPALHYAARGWPVIPLWAAGKRPLTENGLHDASSDLDTVAAWWSRWPAANVGLRTGDSFDVLDLDSAAGLAALGHDLPGGPAVRTGRGFHLYMRPTGLGNRAGIVPEVDWRGRNGYVIAPPSVHPSGRRYRWSTKRPIGTPLEPVPDWLLDLIEPPRPVPDPIPVLNLVSRLSPGYGLSALGRELDQLLAAPEGTRNHRLNRAAFSLGGLVAVDLLDEITVVRALLAAANQIGLGLRESEATVASGLRAGVASPRQVNQ